MEMKDILKSRRLELKLTQKEVADFVGVSEATLSRWESGEIKNLRRNRIALLAKILQIPPSAIVGEDEKEVDDIIYEKIKKSVTFSDGLSDKDIRLIEWFRSLPEEKQKAILISQDAPEGLF